MQWVAISGSWRQTNDDVIEDVEEVVRTKVKNGAGIVTGGALGVDYAATDTVLTEGNPAEQLRIYLPISVSAFCKHYRQSAEDGVITDSQANAITSQLMKVNKLYPEVIRDDTPYQEANKESYYARNTCIIQNCDILFAFQVNNSKGTQDAIDKAKELGKEVHINTYTI